MKAREKVLIIDRICQMPKLFPDAKAKNLLICVTSSNYQGKYGCFIVDKISDLGLQSNAQNFPIRVYNTEEKNHNNLFGNNNSSNYTHGVSDVGLKHFQMAYPDSRNKLCNNLFHQPFGWIFHK